MDWLLVLLLVVLVVCFFLIIKGGDMFVESSVWIAEITRMPQVLIGATIVSLGTTLPEITVSIISSIQGDYGLAVTNAVGSMLCNVALILGVSMAAVVSVINRKSFLEKMIVVSLTTILVFIFAIDGSLSLIESLILLVVFVLFMFLNVKEALKENKLNKHNKVLTSSQEEAKSKNPTIMILFFILGAACIGAGAYFLIQVISKIATDYLFISTEVLGVTVVAAGTSLPELVTAITSIKKKATAISFGNVLGANIINGSFLTGVCGIIAGGFVVANVASFVLATLVCFVSLAILLLPIIIKGRTYKWQGYFLLILYTLYITYLVLSTVGVF